MYQDRHDAALQLASRLSAYRGQHPLVLGIPRGGVPMAHCIAQSLHGDLDVIMARKIAHPLLPEYAIGAIGEDGWTYFSPFADTVVRDPNELDIEKLRQLDLIRRRRAQYTPTRSSIAIRDRIVIVVDDGLATGATMMAALHDVRSQRPGKLVCAIPVGSHEGLHHIRPWVDELICLETPARLDAISQHYRHFDQVDDAEVVQCLRSLPPSSLKPSHEPQTTRLS